jgi:Fe-S cluster biogenesis protein NfuA
MVAGSLAGHPLRRYTRETMAQETALQNQIQRIAGIVQRLESEADPNSRALAKELLESLMALHGAGLERILELARQSGETGDAIIEKCGKDELVSSVLLLYGLHPDDLKTRVERAIEKSGKFLEPHAAHAELVSISEDGSVKVRLQMKPNGGCGSTAATLRATLEAALQDAAPDAASILIEEIGTAQPGFVPIAQLQSGQSMPAFAAARAQRSGD